MKKKTHEWFISEVSIKRPDIIVLGYYQGIDTKITCKCKTCGYQWNVTPYNILHNKGCPECAKLKRGKKRLTNTEFVLRMQDINSDIILLSEYTISRNKVSCKCKHCGNEWSATANSLLMGGGCPECAKLLRREHIKKSHKRFIQELNEVNKGILILEEYQGANLDIKCKCLECNYEWQTKANDLLRGHGCPECNKSRGEIYISQYLQSHNIDFIPQYRFEDCKNIKPLPFDFYLPKHNICIEYDGRQHFEPIDIFGGEDEFIATQCRDNIKNQYCRQKHITLIRIPYFDYSKIPQILDTYIF